MGNLFLVMRSDWHLDGLNDISHDCSQTAS